MTHEDSKLIDAFESLTDQWQEGKDCPEADAFYAAHNQELPANEIAAIIDHTTRCGACAESWRLSKALKEQRAEFTADQQPGGAKIIRFQRFAAPLAIAAALVLFAFLGVFRQTDPVTDPTYRNEGLQPVRSLLSADELLPREHCLLRWSLDPAVANATYQVHVTTEDLMNSVVTSKKLEDTQFLVDAEKLKDLPKGSTLLWYVQVFGPDGDVIRSSTFNNRLD